MDNDYPSEEQLLKIREWSNLSDTEEFINFICSIWHWGEDQYRFKKEGSKWTLELHTGGWSGNEDIIGEMMRSNNMFWLMYWSKSERGGHYYFDNGLSVRE